MKNYFKHLFIPHNGNDYHPHILRDFSIIIILFGILFVSCSLIFLTGAINQSNISAIYSAVLVDLTNNHRNEVALGTLKINPLLVKAAELKAQDMAEKGYFAHESPDGKKPWYWIHVAGYDYLYAGENLAINFTDSTDVENAWMASPGHRANILNEHFTDIGIAMAKGIYQGREATFVVQMFGSEKSSSPPVVSTIQKTEFTTISNEIPGKVLAELSSPTSNKNTIFNETKKVAGESTGLLDASEDNSVDLVSSLNSLRAGDGNSKKIGWFENIFSNPFRSGKIIYLLFAIFISISLLLYIFIECKIHHYKNISYGLLLLIISLCALYIHYSIFFPNVVVG